MVNFANQSEAWFRGLERRRKPIKPATLATWGSIVRAHIVPRLGNADLATFDNGAMKQFADGLCEMLKARTVRDIVMVTKMVVASATDENGDQIYSRAWNDSFIDLPPVTATRTPSADSKTIEQLISNSPPKYGILYALLAGTGLRLGEALAIRIGDDGEHTVWDRNASVIHVRKSVFRGIEQFPKTNAAIRSVDLCGELNDALARFAEDRRNGDFLFSSRSGTPLAPATIYKYSLSKTSVRGAHSFRRFRVTHLAEKQVPTEIVKFWIGHAKNDITEKYSRLSENLALRREWVQRIGLGFSIRARGNFETRCEMTKYRHTDRRWEADEAKKVLYRTCPVSGKRIYASEGEAKATAVHRMSDKETGPTKLRIYKCLHCDGWHLTSKEA